MKTKIQMIIAAAALCIATAGCGQKKDEKPGKPEGPAAGEEKVKNPSRADRSDDPGKVKGKDRKDNGQVDRSTFNMMAVRLNLPVYWRSDANRNNKIDPEEVAGLLFYPMSPTWVEKGKLTPAFLSAYQKISSAAKSSLRSSDEKTPESNERIHLVEKDLDQGIPTLVFNDLRGLSDNEKAFVRHMLKAASLIDRLYARQLGLDRYEEKLKGLDPASRSLVRRNWSLRCKAPKTEKNPRCTALEGVGKETSGVYPQDLQADDQFCNKLGKHKDSARLLDPFVVVRREGKELAAVPYTKAYPKLMKAVAETLRSASGSLEGSNEKALQTYLLAAARSFEDNDWNPADEAWSRMNTDNSKWYVRIGPDEVYWDPCNRKAGFHLTLARINRKALVWQKKLSGVRQEMEYSLAKHAGAPYRPRKVSFHLPDFVEIVINAGDDRKELGATIGQSLPNWGPVAKQGRGRTVAMTNLYTDPDSIEIERRKALSLLSPETMKLYKVKPGLGLLATMLHEASHNLGPSHEYKVNGKKDVQIFGGPLATTLEELKAQTAAMWFVDFLLKRKLITAEQAQDSYIDSFMWALGHISRGMHSATGKPKPYSQLAAVHVGFLMEAGAVSYDPNVIAANKKDKGAFTLHLDRWPAAFDRLMKMVAEIKAKGDKERGKALIDKFIKPGALPFEIINDRILRHPKASFVYSISL